MDHETLLSILPYIGVVLGFVGLFIALTIKKAIKSLNGISKLPTYSSNVDKAVIEHGIYIEHGMAREKKTSKLKPQSKVSKSFFNSLT